MVNEQVVNRVSIPQLEFLAQCMEQFPSLALASFGKSREETSCAHKKWLQIGSALNKIKPGVTKTGLGWLRYWTNYKYQLRKRFKGQFKQSWASEEPERVTPLERRFIQVLADHETNNPSYAVFQGDQNAESYPTADEEGNGILATSYPTQEILQPMPANQEIPQSMPAQQEITQSTSTKQEFLESIPIMQVVDISLDSHPRKQESPGVEDDDDDKQDDDYSAEDPIGTEKESKEDIQIEILKFNLKRQREMHELEIAQMKERHKLEMDILKLKKRKLMKDCDRLKSVYKLINN